MKPATRDAENEAALAQPAHPEEDDGELDEATTMHVSTIEDSMTETRSNESDNPDPEASK